MAATERLIRVSAQESAEDKRRAQRCKIDNVARAGYTRREVFIELTGINVTGILPVIRFVVCKADSDSAAFPAEVANPWNLIEFLGERERESPFSVALRGGNIMESRAEIKVSGGSASER